ncbi:TlpA family protein disulfide reductase [Flavitalea sp.]|nr:TlpA disulfide reductase family protein [Flavitalea sp.]
MQQAKMFLTRCISCIATITLLFKRQRQIIGWATSCQLTFTILLQLGGLLAKSQSTLEISVTPNHQTVEMFTFSRVNSISGSHTIDTFAVKGAGKYSLKVINSSLPGIGVIRNGSENLREVFLAPGFPLQLIINTNQLEKSESVSGPWSGLDSTFSKVNTEMSERYHFPDKSSEVQERLKLYNRFLKIIDTDIDARYRSLKDFLFYGLMRQAIDSSDQILGLNDYKMIYLSYLNQLAFGSFRNDIDRRYNYKLNMLTTAQYGKPAPLFKLRDTLGKLHSLDEFKGKLVYIDLWASWCLPCRLETPYMHKIISKYSKRSDIAFIGVAVSDRMQDWKRAIRQDKPRWLQLHDNSTFVANAYAATSVPRYVLIDKAGNVLDFHAPPPSQQAKLVAIIDKELSN